jgi:hypothetical protein
VPLPLPVPVPSFMSPMDASSMDPRRNLVSASTPYLAGKRAGAGLSAASINRESQLDDMSPAPMAAQRGSMSAVRYRSLSNAAMPPRVSSLMSTSSMDGASGVSQTLDGGFGGRVSAAGVETMINLTLAIEHDPQADGAVSRASLSFDFDRVSGDCEQTARDIAASLADLGTMYVEDGPSGCIPMFAAFLAAQKFAPSVSIVTGAIPRWNWRSVRLGQTEFDDVSQQGPPGAYETGQTQSLQALPAQVVPTNEYSDLNERSNSTSAGDGPSIPAYARAAAAPVYNFLRASHLPSLPPAASQQASLSPHVASVPVPQRVMSDEETIPTFNLDGGPVTAAATHDVGVARSRDVSLAPLSEEPNEDDTDSHSSSSASGGPMHSSGHDFLSPAVNHVPNGHGSPASNSVASLHTDHAVHKNTPASSASIAESLPGSVDAISLVSA